MLPHHTDKKVFIKNQPSPYTWFISPPLQSFEYDSIFKYESPPEEKNFKSVYKYEELSNKNNYESDYYKVRVERIKHSDENNACVVRVRPD